MRIAQIADTHLTLDDPQRLADLRAVVSDINAVGADVVVHTGDVVQNGTPEEYRSAAAVLAELQTPLFLIPGNKDRRAAMRDAFPGMAGEDFVQYGVDDWPVDMIFLDTVSTNSKLGTLCPARLEDLDTRLSRAKTPTAIFMHHPPFPVTVGPDLWHFEDPDIAARFQDRIEKSPRVTAVICGHVHRPFFSAMGGALGVVAPAVATPVRWGDYPDAMRARAIWFLHRFASDGRFTTETRLT